MWLHIDLKYMPHPEKPKISLVVVSDFEASQQKTWQDEIEMAQALAEQDIDAPFEVIFVESDEFQELPLPRELHTLLPDAVVIFHPATRSADLKDHGVTVAAGEERMTVGIRHFWQN